MQQTYGGVFRETPIVPLPAASNLLRGMVLQWSIPLGLVIAWVNGATPALGVATSDSNTDLGMIDVYCGKGASVLVKCDVGIVPNPNDFLYYSSPGLVGITGVAGQAFARAIAVGFDGYVEAIIV
jgi:hypothetical protein